jgi:hypothetical protein
MAGLIAEQRNEMLASLIGFSWDVALPMAGLSSHRNTASAKIAAKITKHTTRTVRISLGGTLARSTELISTNGKRPGK